MYKIANSLQIMREVTVSPIPRSTKSTLKHAALLRCVAIFDTNYRSPFALNSIPTVKFVIYVIMSSENINKMYVRILNPLQFVPTPGMESRALNNFQQLQCDNISASYSCFFIVMFSRFLLYILVP